MHRRFALAAAAAALAALASTVPSPAAAQRSAYAAPHLQTLAINAVGLPFGLFSGEYEASVGSGFTLGAGGSYLSSGGFGSVRGWAEGKALYYPSEAAFEGVGLGLTAGALHASNDVRGDTRPTFGILADYNLLLGASRRLVLGTGLGVRRIIGDIPHDSPLHRVYPDARAVVGLAF